MKRTKLIINNVCVGIIIASILSGCSFIPSVELTSDESSVISEYAAGLVMKYQRGHANGVMKVPGLDENDFTPTPAVSLPVEEAAVAEDMPMENADDEALVEAFETAEEEVEEEFNDATLIPLNEALGLNGANLTFSYCDICKTYPQDEENGELTFSMNATEGRDLLIAHFDLYNPTGEDMYCQTSLDGRKVRMIVNGEEKLRGEITILSNDLMNYANTIAAQSADDVVLVFEIEEGVEISSLTLSLVGKEDILNYNL